MQKAILFRSMLDSLNPTEFEQFLNTLYTKKNKRNIITKSLFYLLSDECKRNEHTNCDDINIIITNIIHQSNQRKLNSKETTLKKSKSTSSTNNSPKDSNSDSISIISTSTCSTQCNECDTLSIDSYETSTTNISISFRELPSPTISECASYLHFSELPSFLYCSRYIYISCKSTPTTTVSLDEKEWFRQYINNYGEAGINYQLTRLLQQYRMIQYISLHSINQIIQLQTIWRWQSLHTIHIHNPTWTYSQNQISSVTEIIKNTDITHLKLSDSKSIESGSELETLCHLICANKSIQFLSIANIRIFSQSNVNINADTIKDLSLSFKFNNLKGLMARTSDPIIYDEILKCNMQSNKLQSFHLEKDQWESYELDASSTRDKWQNLKELCIANLSGQQFKHIIKNSHNLKRFHWRLDYDELPQNQGYNEVIQSILKQNRNLDYLSIEYNQNIENVIEPIHNQLTHDTMTKRYNFKLKIVVISMEDLNFIIDHLDKILRSLSDAVTNDFMLILDISDNFKVYYEDFEVISNKYNDKYLCRAVTHSVTFGDNDGGDEDIDLLSVSESQECIVRFAIYNYENKMCGFNERWIMKCPKCCNIVDHGI